MLTHVRRVASSTAIRYSHNLASALSLACILQHGNMTSSLPPNWLQ